MGEVNAGWQGSSPHQGLVTHSMLLLQIKTDFWKVCMTYQTTGAKDELCRLIYSRNERSCIWLLSIWIIVTMSLMLQDLLKILKLNLKENKTWSLRCYNFNWVPKRKRDELQHTINSKAKFQISELWCVLLLFPWAKLGLLQPHQCNILIGNTLAQVITLSIVVQSLPQSSSPLCH